MAMWEGEQIVWQGQSVVWQALQDGINYTVRIVGTFTQAIKLNQAVTRRVNANRAAQLRVVATTARQESIVSTPPRATVLRLAQRQVSTRLANARVKLIRFVGARR